jgi:hypothetical protein
VWTNEEAGTLAGTGFTCAHPYLLHRLSVELIGEVVQDTGQHPDRSGQLGDRH